jgi:hypothetical protein
MRPPRDVLFLQGNAPRGTSEGPQKAFSCSARDIHRLINCSEQKQRKHTIGALRTEVNEKQTNNSNATRDKE